MILYRWQYYVLTLCLLVAQTFAQSISEQANRAYEEKEYEKSAQLYRAAIRGGERDVNTFYNGACSFARAGKKNEAFDLLAQAIQLGYANADHLKKDTDFNSLHSDSRWKPIVEKCEATQKWQTSFWGTPAFKTPFNANLSEDEKLAGLMQFWSEVRYNFANFDLVPTLEWDKMYLEYLPKVRQTKSTLEYYRVMMELCARLKDAHTNVMVPSELRDEMFARPMLTTRLIEGKVLVQQVLDDKLKPLGIVPGVEVIEVNGTPVQQFAEQQVRPYQSASTEQDMRSRLYEYALLNGSVKEAVTLTFRDAAGKVFKHTLPRVSGKDRPHAFPQPPSFAFKVLPGNIAYVELNTFASNEAFEKFVASFDEIAKTDALIFDIRENSGGNSSVGWGILTYLTDKPFKTSRWRTRDYRPSFRAWGNPEGWHDGGSGEQKPNGAKLYSKPVIVLTSPRTFSAAEDFAVAFDAMQRGTLLGEATGGSTGQPLVFTLPGGGSARVCTKRDTYPDGREFVGVGVQPHIKIAPTVADQRAGRDTVLEAALAELKKQHSK
ncbi:MAG TPA: S41 family peptidase [Blastocatellia bacterium]|nr:S41 family peptidase [Blastocatellia bacterium]